MYKRQAKDGAVDRITVLDSRETPGMGDVAMEKMTQAIIDNQTLAVDTISGATLTSMAFLTAVGSALDAMGESADDWKNREPAAWVSDVEPVSYTHLDVYKRQPIHISWPPVR